MNVLAVIGQDRNNEVFPCERRGHKAQLRHTRPACGSLQKLYIAHPSRIGSKVKAEMARGIVGARFGALNQSRRKRALGQTEKLPASVISKGPLSREGLPLIIESPLVVGMEDGVRQLGFRYQQQREFKLREGLTDFAVSGFELADDLLIDAFQQPVASIQAPVR